MDPKGGFGIEMGLARALAPTENSPDSAKTTPKLAVVKAAWSGTGLKDDWFVDASGKDGPCYSALVAEVKAAVKARKEPQASIRLRGFCWVQGETEVPGPD